MRSAEVFLEFALRQLQAALPDPSGAGVREGRVGGAFSLE